MFGQAKGLVKDAARNVPNPSEAVDKVQPSCFRPIMLSVAAVPARPAIQTSLQVFSVLSAF